MTGQGQIKTGEVLSVGCCGFDYCYSIGLGSEGVKVLIKRVNKRNSMGK